MNAPAITIIALAAALATLTAAAAPWPAPDPEPLAAGCGAAATWLTGTWQNELGSQMKLQADSGILTGEYHSAVGQATAWYPLAGCYTCGAGRVPTVAFAVGWQTAAGSSNSSTAWAGQLTGPNTLVTTWLLVSAAEKPADLWGSVRVGADVFARPSLERGDAP